MFHARVLLPIENLIAAYAELGVAGVGILLADATFPRPRTRHVTTNVAIEVDEEAGTAVSRSCFTALQALPDFQSQPW